VARHAFTTREHGDLHIGGDAALLERRRRAVLDAPWTWLRQVHGADVVTVTEPGEHAGATADAAVTAAPGAALAVHTADCVPVLLEADGVVGAAHAGWRGLHGGVLERTVAAMRALGAGDVTAHVGPHIRSRCYEFGAAELDEVAARLGDAVRAETAWGTPALDLAAGVRAALAPLGVDVVDHGGCTACEPDRWFSHRARADAGRQAGVISLQDGSRHATERPTVGSRGENGGVGR